MIGRLFWTALMQELRGGCTDQVAARREQGLGFEFQTSTSLNIDPCIGGVIWRSNMDADFHDNGLCGHIIYDMQLLCAS
jgi:hypothetical protein